MAFVFVSIFSNIPYSVTYRNNLKQSNNEASLKKLPQVLTQAHIHLQNSRPSYSLFICFQFKALIINLKVYNSSKNIPNGCY